ncbi:MAG: radical SAM protein [Rhodobacteraceae bacterium]|nr:radical SAM protein [Paracoccaceae bacterium]
MLKNSVSELVINWHLTEACNFGCKYCYSAWAKERGSRDVVKDRAASHDLIREIYAFFRPGNTANPLFNKMQWKSVRLNFAGGEPLLHSDRIPDLVRVASKFGFNTSLITNGSRLSASLLGEIAPHMSWLGLSLDSTNDQANREIGRVDRRGGLLDLAELSEGIVAEMQKNPSLKLKINTVVNTLNVDEDFTGLISGLSPNKWKILRMLPVVNQNLAVSDAAFQAFVERHHAFHDVYRVEDNDEMLESYIMIDPMGRFFQNGENTLNNGYQYSPPILNAGAAEAFSNMRFSAERYAARYSEVA